MSTSARSMHAESSIEEGGTPSYPEKVDFRIITSDKALEQIERAVIPGGRGFQGILSYFLHRFPLWDRIVSKNTDQKGDQWDKPEYSS